jgi:hypothetical protein
MPTLVKRRSFLIVAAVPTSPTIVSQYCSLFHGGQEAPCRRFKGLCGLTLDMLFAWHQIALKWPQTVYREAYREASSEAQEVDPKIGGFHV